MIAATRVDAVVTSRDRHGRGLRSRLSWPNPYTGRAVPVPGHESPEAFFATCVSDALAQINRSCPRALVSVDVGFDDVPTLDTAWAGLRVPLAAALTPTVHTHGQIVLFRRPLERRAASRRGLRILVYRTIVEQLASMTGISVDEIDPDGHSAHDE